MHLNCTSLPFYLTMNAIFTNKKSIWKFGETGFIDAYAENVSIMPGSLGIW